MSCVAPAAVYMYLYLIGTCVNFRFRPGQQGVCLLQQGVPAIDCRTPGDQEREQAAPEGEGKGERRQKGAHADVPGAAGVGGWETWQAQA